MSSWMKLGWFLAVLLAVTGCKTSRPKIEPPKIPEEMVMPPEEARFSRPIEYPKHFLNQPLTPSSPGPNDGIPNQPGQLRPSPNVGGRSLNSGF